MQTMNTPEEIARGIKNYSENNEDVFSVAHDTILAQQTLIEDLGRSLAFALKQLENDNGKLEATEGTEEG